MPILFIHLFTRRKKLVKNINAMLELLRIDLLLIPLLFLLLLLLLLKSDVLKIYCDDTGSDQQFIP